MAQMTALALVQSLLETVGVRSILVGGFAVVHYGYQRATQDLDLMIMEEDLPKVKEALERDGLSMTNLSDVCAKFKKSGFGLEAVDFVMVSSATFHKVLQSGQRVVISGKDFVVPSLENLIAMKLHSIKQDPEERMMKDLPDIARLLRTNNIDPRSSFFQDLCLKFGTQESYDTLLRFFKA